MPAVGIAGVVGDVRGQMSVDRHAIVRTLVETVPPRRFRVLLITWAMTVSVRPGRRKIWENRHRRRERK